MFVINHSDGRFVRFNKTHTLISMTYLAIKISVTRLMLLLLTDNMPILTPHSKNLSIFKFLGFLSVTVELWKPEYANFSKILA